MRNRRRRQVRHQARVGYLDKGPLCQCGRWHCPDLGRELDRSIDRSERIMNVGQLLVLLLSMLALIVCCVGGALWIG